MMPKITYIESNGTKHTVKVESGLSLMRGAIENGVPGIIADCGGNCACGTCRVFVEPQWRAPTGEASDMEAAILEGTDEYDEKSPGRRLSCQIEVSDALDGMVVRMPKRQF